MDFQLDEQKNDVFKNQLHLLFEQYKSACKREKGLIYFQYEPLNEDNKKLFGDSEPAILKNLNMILSSIPMFSKGGEIKIYKLARNSKLFLEPNPDVLARFLLPVGSDGFTRTQISHGISTGRGLKIVQILKGGSLIILQPQQSLHILSEPKATVFIKGKGKTEVTKDTVFEQFLVYFEMKFDQKLLKGMKDDLMKSGGDVNSLLKSKLSGVSDMGFDLDEEMKKFNQAEVPVIEVAQGDEEFLA